MTYGDVEQYRKVVKGFQMILDGLGVPLNEHTRDTADRAAKAWWNELCAGLTSYPPTLTTFDSDVDEMILIRGIPVKSLCAHHLLPFFGTATIGYVPSRGKILGISKLSRVTDYYARRPQVQEDLTQQIADAVAELVIGPRFDPRSGEHGETGGVGVIIQANHTCMQLRGVNHTGDLTTSAMRGVFRDDPAARAEFLNLARNGG